MTIKNKEQIVEVLPFFPFRVYSDGEIVVFKNARSGRAAGSRCLKYGKVRIKADKRWKKKQ